MKIALNNNSPAGTFLLALGLLINLPSRSTAARQDELQPTASKDRVPEQVAKSDWQGIRAAYDASRHQIQSTGDGWQARNPGQQWTTKFDHRGFLTKPKDGQWSWGLELKSYGFCDQQTTISSAPSVQADGQRLTYDWNATLQEWFVNDQRGLEHGFTVKQRPERASSSERATLDFTLATRGSLRPKVSHDSLAVSFENEAGATIVNYTGLKVWDADGKVLASRFEPAGENTIRLLVEESDARYPITIDPVAQQAYLKASNTDTGDTFGFSVAISGDTVVVGAINEDSATTGVNSTPNESAPSSGAAYVFVRSGGTWSQQAYLKASDTAAENRFGWKVGISGDTVVVGAIQDDGPHNGLSYGNGAAYVFVRSGTTWSQQQKLTASNPDFEDIFGSSVSVDGDTIVVGAHYEDSNGSSGADDTAVNAGAAYVFVRSGVTWSQQAYLKEITPNSGRVFGYSVSVSGDTAAVSALNGNRVTIFVRSGSVWTRQAILLSLNSSGVFGDGGDYFGRSISLSGDTLAVGASDEDSNATGVNGDGSNNSSTDSGAAYVFVRSGTNWSQQAYIKPNNTGPNDEFGMSVSLLADALIVGSWLEDSSTTGVNSSPNESATDCGAAYLFTRNGTNWTQRAYFKPSQTGVAERFGFSTALSEDTVIIGAYLEDSSTTGVNSTPNEGGLDSGAAYIFGLIDFKVIGNSVNIAEDDATPSSTDHTDFGAATIGSSTVARTFTITNTGLALLQLTPNPKVSFSGTHAADFSVIAEPASTVPAGSATSFQVRFTPGGSGLRTATVSINNSDIGSPFEFAVQGWGNNAPDAQHFTIGAMLGETVSFTVIGGKFAPTDADGDSLAISNVSPATTGVSGFTASNITYVASGSLGTNTFQYTVTDAFGATDNKKVTVVVSSPVGFNKLSGPTGTGPYSFSYLGIPGQNYALDESPNLVAPFSWFPIITNTAASNGALDYLGVTLSYPSGSFRTRHVP